MNFGSLRQLSRQMREKLIILKSHNNTQCIFPNDKMGPMKKTLCYSTGFVSGVSMIYGVIKVEEKYGPVNILRHKIYDITEFSFNKITNTQLIKWLSQKLDERNEEKYIKRIKERNNYTIEQLDEKSKQLDEKIKKDNERIEFIERYVIPPAYLTIGFGCLGIGGSSFYFDVRNTMRFMRSNPQCCYIIRRGMFSLIPATFNGAFLGIGCIFISHGIQKIYPNNITKKMNFF